MTWELNNYGGPQKNEKPNSDVRQLCHLLQLCETGRAPYHTCQHILSRSGFANGIRRCRRCDTRVTGIGVGMAGLGGLRCNMTQDLDAWDKHRWVTKQLLHPGLGCPCPPEGLRICMTSVGHYPPIIEVRWGQQNRVHRVHIACQDICVKLCWAREMARIVSKKLNLLDLGISIWMNMANRVPANCTNRMPFANIESFRVRLTRKFISFVR